MQIEPNHTDVIDGPIYFPLDQGESSSHLHVNQLLPRAVYARLAELLAESVVKRKNIEPNPEAFQRGRGHSTIFIDGNRGTGKTTVIVNLLAYLQAPEVKQRYPHLANDVHILSPIDPSQLEDNDDLFLNVIVAAVLSDHKIKKAAETDEKNRQALHESLQKLGDALEGRETQNVGVGLDRLRSFMGTQALAAAVHDFFNTALRLVKKRLLVLPIDDVDTTLHRAFDNLEVVRRYLSSPVVVPIVCGDLDLYQDVTWRDAYRRLSKDVSGFGAEAKQSADELALEYLRKILPLQRRLQMPTVDTFLHNSDILLGGKDEVHSTGTLSLPDFQLWLRAFLAGPVNDHENSALHIPIPTVRALSQLLDRVRKEIPNLIAAFHAHTRPNSATDLMRRLAFLRAGETLNSRGSIRPETPEKKPQTQKARGVSLGQWQSALLEHFMFEPDAGAVCLVLMASRHWRDSSTSSVLATPLFSPLMQRAPRELRYIEAQALLAWGDELKGRLPDSWLGALPNRAVLPFATPEIGRAVKAPSYLFSEEEIPNDQQRMLSDLLLELVSHRNFYTSNKQATLLCVGRIFELVVTSLIREVTAADIDRILDSSPFHSAAAVASTKSLHFTDDDEVGPEVNEVNERPNDIDRDLAISDLVGRISKWRKEYRLQELGLSPWLVYCALNKAFNQAPLFNRPLVLKQQPLPVTRKEMVDTALAAFHALWSAFASFEKGPVFGLPAVLSNVNLTTSGNFERNELFLQNILPLLKSGKRHSIRDESVLSVTRVLDDHPLRIVLRTLQATTAELERTTSVSELQRSEGRAYLLELLGLDADTGRLTVAKIVSVLTDIAGREGRSAVDIGNDIREKVRSTYSSELDQLRTLERAIERLVNSEH